MRVRENERKKNKKGRKEQSAVRGHISMTKVPGAIVCTTINQCLKHYLISKTEARGTDCHCVKRQS